MRQKLLQKTFSIVVGQREKPNWQRHCFFDWRVLFPLPPPSSLPGCKYGYSTHYAEGDLGNCSLNGKLPACMIHSCQCLMGQKDITCNSVEHPTFPDVCRGRELCKQEYRSNIRAPLTGHELTDSFIIVLVAIPLTNTVICRTNISVRLWNVDNKQTDKW